MFRLVASGRSSGNPKSGQPPAVFGFSNSEKSGHGEPKKTACYEIIVLQPVNFAVTGCESTFRSDSDCEFDFPLLPEHWLFISVISLFSSSNFILSSSLCTVTEISAEERKVLM